MHSSLEHVSWLGGKPGRIALARHSSLGRQVVLKMDSDKLALMRELDILQRLGHADSSAVNFVCILEWQDLLVEEAGRRSCLVLEVRFSFFLQLVDIPIHVFLCFFIVVFFA